MSDIGIGTSAAGTSAAGTNGNFKSAAMQGLDTDVFLQLLVAQMKYQNPLDPMDSSQFLSQASQFAMVEQLEALTSAQAELKAMQTAMLSTDLVGRQVTGTAMFTNELVTGVVETVKLGTDTPVLMVDGRQVPLTSVIEVTDRPATEGGQSQR